MIQTIDHNDPGDETLQRFRYQHAYGVMLALAAIRDTGGTPFTAVYCEHHEDLLGELQSGGLHAFQVKTRKKELGYWTNTDEAFVHSIKRFVELDIKYGVKVEQFVFVSNVELRNVDTDNLKTTDVTRATSPSLLLKACRECTDAASLPKGVLEGFERLRETCGCTSAQLFAVLQRMSFHLGPDLYNFEPMLIADQLPEHPECKELPPSHMRRLARELIAMFTVASSLPADPDAAVLPSNNVKRGVATARTKRVLITDVASVLTKVRTPYKTVTLDGDLSAASLTANHHVLEQKLQEGGLAEQSANMKRRLLTTFEWVRELQIIDVDEAQVTLRQLESIVEGVYADEHAGASNHPLPWGSKLYTAMLGEFRSLTHDQPSKVCNQDHERLFGVAALLTENCRIWWSPRFALRAVP
jgi:Cap4 dsDNA endonuclease